MQISVNNASLEALKAKQAQAQESIATLSADSVEYMRLSREANITGQVYTSLVQNYEQTRIPRSKRLYGYPDHRCSRFTKRRYASKAK